MIAPNGFAAAAAILLKVPLRGIGNGSFAVNEDDEGGLSVGVYGPPRSSESSVSVEVVPSVASKSLSKPYVDEAAETGDGADWPAA